VRKPRPISSSAGSKARDKQNELPVSVQGRVDLWICLLLLLAVCAVYAPVHAFDFVNYDDPQYVRDNPHVREGLTVAAVRWAFTSGELANWFPITRLSHMLDAQFFGIHAGPQHVTGVFFHAAAALFLFLFLRRATGLRWPSALVALLFAVHPLHVESAAWIAERKDVLCASFWFLSLWAYVRYVEMPGRGRYLMVLLWFSLGLMAKPMIVTLPVLLLLLDFWPLRRRPAYLEKVPFFLLAAGSALTTYLVQHQSGAVRPFAMIPLALRMENALVSAVVYLAQTVWPTRLAVFYPYPSEIPIWQVALASGLTAIISILVWRARAACPYLLVGWLWYGVTLAPVIGIIQVGDQSRADRYLYVPMVGLLIGLCFGAADWLRRAPKFRPATAGIAAGVVLCCAVVARAQVGYWKDSEALFEHALEVTGENNYVAQHNLGAALADNPERLPDAIRHYQEAVRINPGSVTGHVDLANVLSAAGRWSEAVPEYQAGLRLAPDYVSAHNNFGSALAKLPGRLPDAIAEYRTAIRLDPANPEVHNNLGCVLAQMPGEAPQAIAEFRSALSLRPDYPEAHANLAGVLAGFPDRLPEAASEYETAVRSRPESPELHYGMAVLLTRMGKAPEAIAQFEEALKLRPDFAEAHNYLGVALLRYPNRASEAVQHLKAALQINPDYAEAHYNLGGALMNSGDRQAALVEFEAALRLNPDPKLRQLVERLRRAGR